MTPSSILIVDSDATARGEVADSLRSMGHSVRESDALTAMAAARQFCPEVLLCDLVLSDLDGIDLLADIRRSERLWSTRVLVTASRVVSEEVMLALESGADDFIGKPIDAQELCVRISACLRRPANTAAAPEITAGGILIDSISHRVTVDREALSLAPREYQLLRFMLTHQDEVFSRKQLLWQVWSRDATVGARTVDVHIRRLRSLLEPFGYARYIQTVRGSGYRFSLLD
jgi:two-component system phosphate regulon response regulator PhoB